MKQKIIRFLPYVIFALICSKLPQAWRYAGGTNFGETFLNINEGLAEAFSTPFPSFYGWDFFFGVAMACVLWLVAYYKRKNAKHFRHGEEYGSARWGTKKDIAPYMDKNFENNVILTEMVRISMEPRMPEPKYNTNKNVICIGGSGTGKTFRFLKPNLMQCHSSFVVTDPKGGIVLDCGDMLLKMGYKIKIFNTVNFKKSMHYNPFAYICSETDIFSMSTVIISNTDGKEKGSSNDPFWDNATKTLYCALIGYLYYEAPPEEQNIFTMASMIRAYELREDDPEFKNTVDLLFEELKERNPKHFAVLEYQNFRAAGSGKTMQSILSSAITRLMPFDINALQEITSYDEMGLDLIGDQKTALFFIVSDTDPTFNFLVAMAQTQMFTALVQKADSRDDHRLPIHVRCLLDEVANIGKIPNLERLMATIRSREISACLILQSINQLKSLYKDDAETIKDTCDSTLFLGSQGQGTLKEMSEMLGKETIDTFTTSDSRGSQCTYNMNYQKTGRELMTPAELGTMDGAYCICQIRGSQPFYSKKYDITKHPRYHMLADSKKGKNLFDIEKYLKRRLKIPKGKVETFVIDD